MSDTEQTAKEALRKAEEEWGVGNKAQSKPFATALLGSGVREGEPITVELLHGQYPHSRRDENTYARTPSGEIYAFNGHRPLIDFKFESYNYLKTSEWSGDEIRKGGSCTILMDRVPVYSFFYREWRQAFREAEQKVTLLMEHTIAVWDPAAREAAIGRAVYYQRTPATVTGFDWEDGEVYLSSDLPEGFPPLIFELEEYANGERRAPPEREMSVRTDLFDPNIWWHRKRLTDPK